jgi:hypothetical protein
MPETRSRRQRLVLLTAAVGAGALLAVVAMQLLDRPGTPALKPAPEPYVPRDKVEVLTDLLPPDYPRIEFVEVAREAGIDFQHFHGTRTMKLPEDMGSGAAWADYDNDGLLDLYVVNTAGPLTMDGAELARSPAHNSLYHNVGSGAFVEVADAAGVDYRSYGQAAAWGDYDNDGFVDLVVTNYGANLLYRNRGDGTFDDVTATAGVGAIQGFWGGASWGDYDRDGDLDLHVAGYVQYSFDPAHVRTETKQYGSLIPASLNPATYKPERNLLYRNEGERFSERGGEAGVANITGRSLSASWCDFDNDGWIDLYVANDVSENALFLNRADGNFADVSHSAWVADYRGGMGLAVGDWDADGDQDFLVTNWVAQENAFYNNMTQEYAEAGLNRGQNLRFMSISDQIGLGHISLDYVGWGTAFLDYDNDGKQDILVVNGSTMQQSSDPTLLIPMRNLLFWNQGRDEGFFEVGLGSGEIFSRKQVGRGLAVGDYDNDGDTDAFVVVNGGTAQLLRNDAPQRNHWLKVRLQGRDSNRDGLNVRLRAVVGEREFHREVGATSSYYSQHALGEELFGLGTATQVDSLEIGWPSGQSDLMLRVRADQTVTVIEGETAGARTTRM